MKQSTIEIPGKWVLTGEHAVLRDYSALAFPHPDAKLTISFEQSQSPFETGLEIFPSSAREMIFELLGILLQLLKQKPEALPSGTLEIQSSIPLGAGLGSSAALCVGLVRWISKCAAEGLGCQVEDGLFLASRLEDYFHGQSSGMDVAVAWHEKPIHFRRGRPVEALALSKVPHFRFHDTGLRTPTRICIDQVEEYRRENPLQSAEIDRKMGESTHLALSALMNFSEGKNVDGALEVLSRAMDQAQACFEAWGLVDESINRQRADILSQGALAVKVTGAGKGGFLVSLWEEPESVRSLF
jgi:mevalonate kinase